MKHSTEQEPVQVMACGENESGLESDLGEKKENERSVKKMGNVLSRTVSLGMVGIAGWTIFVSLSEPDFKGPIRFDFKEATTFYQPVVDLELPNWSYDESYRLLEPEEDLRVKTTKDGTFEAVVGGDLSPFLIDELPPKIESFQLSLDQESKSLTVKWKAIEQEGTQWLSFEWPSHNQFPSYSFEVPYQSGFKSVVLEYQDQKITLGESGSYTFKDLSYGTHQIKITAFDQAGNASTTQTESVYLEKPLPTIPTDAKGQLLSRISSRHATLDEKSYRNMLIGAHQIVPLFVLEVVERAGYDIVLTGNGIREIVRSTTGWDAGWNYHGVTFHQYAGYTRIWSSLKGGVNILVHEIGHAYDFATGRPSLSGEFMKVYHAESLNVFRAGSLYQSTSQEYFAETFRMYLNQRSTLQAKAPQTAAYFRNLFGF